MTTDADQPALPVPPQAHRHGSGHRINVRQSLVTSRESREPRTTAKLTVGRRRRLNITCKYFGTFQRSHENDRDKTIATKRPRQNDRDVATKRSVVCVCQGTVSCCSNYLHSFLCIDVMNITTSLFFSFPLKCTSGLSG